MVKQYLVLHGASKDASSHWSTTSAVDYRGIQHQSRPPASPWMGDHMSHYGYLSSGYQQAFFRDKPPDELKKVVSVHASSFERPKTSSLEEAGPWPGEKDAEPFKSCMKRGEIKEPRFYPFKIGAVLGAQALISPAETDPAARFSPAKASGRGLIDTNATIVKARGKTPSGFSTGNDPSELARLISERQGQGEFRTPSLTMRGAERVASDSSCRYFHARDYYENPFMTSNSYYQSDALVQLEEMKRNNESLTAVPATRPLTQYALAHNDAPYAPDVGEGVGMPIPRVGEGVEAEWGTMPRQERVGLLPTAFTRIAGITSATGDVHDEPPPAPPLPERFARIRARHDYLRWGSEAGVEGRYQSTSRVELCKPSHQNPLGGPRKPPPGGPMVVASDSSGYHMQIGPTPIQPWQ